MIKSAVSVDHVYLTGELTPIFFPYLIFFFGFLIAALVKFILKLKISHGIKRTQLWYVLIGTTLFLVPLFITQLILPTFKIFSYNNLGPLFSLPMVMLIVYAIAKHRLLDIRVAIQRGLIYTVLLVFVVCLYIAITSLAIRFFGKETELTTFASTLITIVFGVFGTPFVERFFRRITDPIFFKNKYDYVKALRDLSAILNENINQNDIVQLSVETLKETFKSKDAVFMLGDGPVTFSDNRPVLQSGHQELLVPLCIKNECIGMLVLREKRSGDAYTEEDVRLLETFAYQASIALEKARLYNEVKGYSETLEQKVQERTERVQKLQQEQQHTMVDIAHGLQTPLTTMRIQLELLKKENPAFANTFNSLEKSVDGVSSLVYDLLKLSRLETSEHGFVKEPVNLSDAIKEFVEYVRTIADAEGITVKDSIAPDLIILGSEKELLTLSSNLASNSFKYMRKDTEKVISIVLVPNKNEAHLIIEDNGIGIAEEDLPKVFNRFYRARAEDVNNTQGSGLGLAIAKKIVERHGGTIAIESRLNIGTKITVSLPLKTT